jgi:hypothetical protein
MLYYITSRHNSWHFAAPATIVDSHSYLSRAIRNDLPARISIFI